jgi:hypothetical protein
MRKLYLTVEFLSEYVTFRGIIFDEGPLEKSLDGFGFIAQKSINKDESYYSLGSIVYHSTMTYVENRLLRNICKQFNRLDTRYQNELNKCESPYHIVRAIHSLVKAAKIEKIFAYGKKNTKEITFDDIVSCGDDWNMLATLIQDNN